MTYYDMFCHQFIVVGSYVVDDQRISSLDDKAQSDRVIRSNNVANLES